VFVAKCQHSMLSVAADNLRQSVGSLTILRFLKVFSQQVNESEPTRTENNNENKIKVVFSVHVSLHCFGTFGRKSIWPVKLSDEVLM